MTHTLRMSRAAVAFVFLANGTLIGIWAAHIPLIKAAHGLSDARLGLVLLGFALGALLTMAATGWLTAHFPSGRVMVVTGIACCLSLALPPLAASIPVLFATAVVLGGLSGAMDIAMNAHAVAVERAWRSHIMSSFHAFFSLGGLVGAGAASLLLACALGPAANMSISAVVLAAAIAAVAPRVWPRDSHPGTDVHAPPHDTRRSAPPRPWRKLAPLGVIGFCSAVAEGAMVDWTAIYLSSVLGAAVTVASVGFAAFSLAMTAGRLTGDAVVGSLGRSATLVGSAAVAALGLTVAVIAHGPAWAAVGFGVAGLGLANIIPIVFSAAGRTTPSAPGVGVATVATLGYAGFLLGPPVIGFVAGHSGLRVGLGLLVAAALLMCAMGARAARDLAEL